MGKEGGLMSVGEADRAAVIRHVVEKGLGRREAAERLGIGVRQIKRLARRYRERGAAGLVSGHRGKRPNNAIDAGVRREVVDLVRKRYPDFGPTFAHEKLVEEHGHRLSAETLRQWMIADGLWRAEGAAGDAGAPESAAAGSAWGTWCRSTARRTPGSRIAGRRAC